MAERLDPLALPLRGSRLIEASAGTGKTWTIAALYLRLVLGHGNDGDNGPARPLSPAEVLVMTFTKAATRELSDRIRQRLVQAAACFHGESVPAADDAFLAGLLAAYPSGPARQQAAWRLALAAVSMDDAAVHTIDAWCQRMLREHAFDSGSLFDEELQAHEAALVAEAARDYWRQQIYPLVEPALDVTLKLWPDVDALAGSVKDLMGDALPPAAGEGSLSECIEAARAEHARALAAIKHGWVDRAADMRAWLDGQLSRADSPFNKNKLKSNSYPAWIDTLAAWAADPSLEALDLTPTAQSRLQPEGLRDAFKPGASVALPACFADFEVLLAALPQLPRPEPALRAHAAVRVAERVRQLKAQAGIHGFADMLERLDRALDPAASGEKAERLRRRILQQHPAALIDEFQDTSPVQLRIFDRLYRIAENDPFHTLLLIGDPKQAIYGFRGADIRSYLTARRQTHGRHHVLGTNHRSTQGLVAAVNGLFGHAEARLGEGAFKYRPPGTLPSPDGDEERGLPFVAVEAKGRKERLVCAEGEVPPLTIHLDDGFQSTGHSRERLAVACAERIVRLLDDDSAGFICEGEPPARLRPADIAVLVRSGIEAEAVRGALRLRGVASVYLSDKDSVYASAEAGDILRLLQAVAAPRDVRLARAALASSLVALPLADLRELASDDARFDAQCELLAELQGVWQSQGVLAMLRRALHGLGMPARWAAGEQAERRLTNVLHLAELLQAASRQLDGEAALIRWLARQLDDAQGDTTGGMASEEQVLRLESDAGLVQVVTVHKSKGLEYPLVFLPFAAHFRAVTRQGNPQVRLHDAGGQPRVVLAPTDVDLHTADEERLQEDLRLLYVALTRARHAVWMGVGAVKRGAYGRCLWPDSALGYLLSGPGPRDAAEVATDVHALAERVPGVRVQRARDEVRHEAPARLRPREALPPLRPLTVYEADFDRLWSISSYSALVKDAARSRAAGAGDVPLRMLREDEPVLEAGGPGDLEGPLAGVAVVPGIGTMAEPVADEAPWHRFPRGALAGNFLHDQLEWLAGEGFALAGNPGLQQALARRCERQGWGHRSEDVQAWLARVCATPLPPWGCSLAGLDRALPEMEFWLPSDGLQASKVDALCRTHVLPGRPRPALPERVLRGLLMGFADLVYEQGGRYGVLDYKSNTLGRADADYTPATMEAAMLEHRYDVQAALYLLALHRLLRRRLGAAYGPQRHLHGAVYLFLRGVAGDSAGAWHLPAPVALIEALDALLAPTPAPQEGRPA